MRTKTFVQSLIPFAKKAFMFLINPCGLDSCICLASNFCLYALAFRVQFFKNLARQRISQAKRDKKRRLRQLDMGQFTTIKRAWSKLGCHNF